jgi:hypothetical protein
MVKQRRPVVLALVAAAVLAVGLWFYLRADDRVTPLVAGATRDGGNAPGGAIPRIGLDRLQASPGEVHVGDRDIFGYGAPPPTPEPPPTQPPEPTLPTPDPLPTPTPLPPLAVKYMGSMENNRGVKVALFVTDKKEVLAGQVGDTVMNRFRVMKIGYESVDVQQVGFDQVQRLPLKPN